MTIRALVKKAGELLATSVQFVGNGLACNPHTKLDVVLGSQEAPKATPFAGLDELYMQLLLTTLPKSNPHFNVLIVFRELLVASSSSATLFLSTHCARFVKCGANDKSTPSIISVSLSYHPAF